MRNSLAKIIAIGAIGLVGFTIYNNGIHERTWREAAHTAARENSNSRGLISPSDYASIYSTLGLKDTKQSALDLSTEQLRNYINIKKSRENKSN